MLGEDFVDQASYQRAVRQAEATYKFASAEGALLIRWVSDPKSIRNGLLWKSLAILAIGAAIEFILAMIFACAMPRPRGKRGFENDRYGSRASKTKDIREYDTYM